MRFVWMGFVGLLVAMVLVLPRLNRSGAPASAAAPATTPPIAAVLTTSPRAVALLRGPAARADSVVAFGLAQRGVPYLYAGTSPFTGFDCSGFILYAFAHVGVAVPHSTALLIDVGRPVARADAQPGDIVVFTGTAPTSTTPGHAGIVITARGQTPLRFVHSSSARRESGVKVSQVEGTDYERRFMQVRRVLGAGEVTAVRPVPAVVPRSPTPVAAVPVRPVAAAGTPMAPLPKVLRLRKQPAPLRAKRTVSKAPVKKTAPVARKKSARQPVRQKVLTKTRAQLRPKTRAPR